MPAGTVIFREGEPGTCAYVIERGSVEISTQRDNERIVIARRAAGEIFGEMAIVDNQPRSATVTASSDCELLVLSAEHLQDRLDALDPILRMVLGVVLDRFRDTMRRMKYESDEVTQTTIASDDADIDFRLERHRAAIERIELELSLKRAIEREELLLHFQPIVCCRTGKITSFESLVRWDHPERGLLYPDSFIEAAEQSDLITGIADYVIAKACEAFLALESDGATNSAVSDDLSISVNVSAREFGDPAFVDRVAKTLRAHGVAPERLTLEITESMLMKNPETTLEILRRCQGIGLSVSIDDFGTGYSSLSQLHRFPFETLKIDRSFLAGLQANQNSKEIVRAMIALGHGLDMKVVAEGVEDAGQALTVQHFDCDFWQGYLFSRPLPLAQMQDLAQDWTGLIEQRLGNSVSLPPAVKASA